MKVPFSTVSRIHEAMRGELDNAYRQVVDNGWFIRGEECRKFERDFADYVGASYCVGVASGLDALSLIMMALGIGEGDEVIVPANTFIATALAVSVAGAKPVFVDPDINDFNIDVEKIEAKITQKTRAIIAVHLQGRPADMDAVNEIAQRYQLKVVEDAAQAHGARYNGHRVGTMSAAAAFSFYPGKNLGALGDGGCVVTNDKELADRVRTLGNYGSDVKYHHIYKGMNSRLDELQSALLRVKLKYLDGWNQERKGIADRYFQGIQNPQIILPPKGSKKFDHIYHVFAIRCQKRDELEKMLTESGIETVKHYPIPIPFQQAYAECHAVKGEYPCAEEISDTVLSIPMFCGMTGEEVEFVIDRINSFC